VPFLLTALGIGQFLRFYQRFRRYLHGVEMLSGGLLLDCPSGIYCDHFLQADFNEACPSPECYPARKPLKSATFKKVKIRPRQLGDRNVAMSHWVENR
jgi:hypothetical protein